MLSAICAGVGGVSGSGAVAGVQEQKWEEKGF